MKPKFKSELAWQQAQLLMQPALIRIVDNIRKRLEQTSWKATYQETQIPVPGYQLLLELGDRQKTLDIWELCYRVCFRDYVPTPSPEQACEVDIDTSLIDEGDVDWERLDEKARTVTHLVLADLPEA
ncbi:MAG: hypothetical protein R6U67_17630 [Sodalinema sp.]|jgi:hypothetical protein|uniref:hypothetical protein n=1 Tax=Sodalinema sp. TaxID=3080550 RepID=UPI0007C32652|nr:hypothetical protein AY600_00855 [Phormidium willei BDU 130791]TAN92133.1 MAG: hypothetical protein EYR95_14465 [Phormidium sp. SL48-SHIP]